MDNVPIPQDWQQEDGFCCYVISWPNSDEWRRVLTGLLLSPSRGRFWSRDTGTITEAQAVGKQIQAENYIYDEECY